MLCFTSSCFLGAAKLLRVQRVRPARGGLVQRVVVAPLGHAFGVRVHRVQRVQKVQRVMVAPCGRNK